MSLVFAPGCALLIYKPELAERVFAYLAPRFPGLAPHHTCCHHEPGLAPGTTIINLCPGCDRRYRELYAGISTVSLWEILAESPDFPFPDYRGTRMSIQDACPTRSQARVLSAVRMLAQRLNIVLVEPARSGAAGACCGDSFYGKLPVEKVEQQMRKRAGEMPVAEALVYCVSCVKSMHIGGKRPRYLADLLFGEETSPGTFEPDAWHRELDEFMAQH